MEKDQKITLLNSFKVPVVLLGIMWLIFIVEWALGTSFSDWGIYPRKLSGLWGVVFSPFLHGDYGHIVNNSAPLIILGGTLYYFYRKIATEILLLGWIIGGVFVWIAARSNYHIGMSGIIYSLAFFIFMSGVFRKEIKLMAISLFVVFLYGSMVWGLFPIDLRVSFEGHIFGAISGIALAYFYQREGATFKAKKYQWEIDEENEKRLLEQGYQKLEDENGFVIRYDYKPSELEPK